MSKILTIDNDLRKITIPDTIKNLGVESDDDVLRLQFEMPRLYGAVDLNDFDVRINYMNAAGLGDVYVVTDKYAGTDKITFSWLVGRTAAACKGNVKFIVCLKQFTDGVVVKEYNTTVATLPVLEGLETTDAVVQNNPDVLEQILLRLDNLEKNGTGGGTVSDERIAQAVANYLNKNPLATIGTVELLADKWAGDNNLYSQVVEVPGATANSQVDLTPSVEQLAIFYNKDLAFVTENEDGVVTVYAIGQKPENDYTIQVTITEVTV